MLFDVNILHCYFGKVNTTGNYVLSCLLGSSILYYVTDDYHVGYVLVTYQVIQPSVYCRCIRNMLEINLQF